MRIPRTNFRKWAFPSALWVVEPRAWRKLLFGALRKMGGRKSRREMKQFKAVALTFTSYIQKLQATNDLWHWNHAVNWPGFPLTDTGGAPACGLAAFPILTPNHCWGWDLGYAFPHTASVCYLWNEVSFRLSKEKVKFKVGNFYVCNF